MDRGRERERGVREEGREREREREGSHLPDCVRVFVHAPLHCVFILEDKRTGDASVHY